MNDKLEKKIKKPEACKPILVVTQNEIRNLEMSIICLLLNLTNEFVFSFQYSFGADPVTSLLEPLEEELMKTTHTYCGKTHPLFTKKLAHSLADVNRKAPSGR